MTVNTRAEINQVLHKLYTQKGSHKSLRSPGDLKEQVSRNGRAWEGRGCRNGLCGPGRWQQVDCWTLRSVSLPQKEFPQPSPSAVWGQGCSPSLKPITRPPLETSSDLWSHTRTAPPSHRQCVVSVTHPWAVCKGELGSEWALQETKTEPLPGHTRAWAASTLAGQVPKSHNKDLDTHTRNGECSLPLLQDADQSSRIHNTAEIPHLISTELIRTDLFCTKDTFPSPRYSSIHPSTKCLTKSKADKSDHEDIGPNQSLEADIPNDQPETLRTLDETYLPTSRQTEREEVEAVTDFISLAPKSLQTWN